MTSNSERAPVRARPFLLLYEEAIPPSPEVEVKYDYCKQESSINVDGTWQSAVDVFGYDVWHMTRVTKQERETTDDE